MLPPYRRDDGRSRAACVLAMKWLAPLPQGRRHAGVCAGRDRGASSRHWWSVSVFGQALVTGSTDIIEMGFDADIGKKATVQVQPCIRTVPRPASTSEWAADGELERGAATLFGAAASRRRP